MSYLARCVTCGHFEPLKGRSTDERQVRLRTMRHCKLDMVAIPPKEVRAAKALCEGFKNALQPDLPGVPR